MTPDTSLADVTAAANSMVSPLSNYTSLKARHMTPEQIDAVSKDFESMFLSQMMEPMFGDSIGEDAFGSQESNAVYKGMMMNEYGKKIESAGGIGIAASVAKELMKQQEVR